MSEPKSKIRLLQEKLMYNLFKVLSEHEGQMKGAELVARVGEISDLDDWAKELYEKTGYVRWEAMLHLRSITAVKAGFLIKKKGVWYLTDEGQAAFKLGPEKLNEACVQGYAKWKAAQPRVTEVTGTEPSNTSGENPPVDEGAAAAAFDKIESSALQAIEQYINGKNPYEFQDMCAALLRAMGYFTPFVAPKGPDGGVDVIAYRDPLGAAAPRFKVQIKHKNNPSPVDDVRKLIGILGNKENIGIIISSGGFTSDAKREAMHSHVHVELIDLPRFISLWQEFYGKMTDEDKQLMPLQPIYFLSPEA